MIIWGRMQRDACFSGANDDASGVAAVIELARAFAALESRNSRTLMFVAYGAEERERMGSMHQMAHPLPAAPTSKIVLMLSIDMIGSGFEDWTEFSPEEREAYARTWFAEVHNGTATHADAYFFEHERGSDDAGTYDFDTGPFAAAGINTRMIGIADVPHYHQTSDSWENMEFAPTGPLVQTVFDFLWLVDQDPERRARP